MGGRKVRLLTIAVPGSPYAITLCLHNSPAGWGFISDMQIGETEAQRATSLLPGGGAGLAELV